MMTLLILVGGVASHLLYFKRGEHHQLALQYLQALGLLVVALAFVQFHYLDLDLVSAVSSTITKVTLFLAGNFTSLLTYRLFFNPLNSIPGPFLARITRFHATSLVLRDHDSHFMLNRLHRRYGPFVRVGPNDVSIIHPDAMLSLHGANTKFTKAAFYDADHPQTSLQTTRNKQVHANRRKHWVSAFSDKALRGYEHRIWGHIDLLANGIEKLQRKPIDFVQFISYMTFDVMGELAFGTSFNMLQSAKAHWVSKTITDGLEIFGMLFPTWLFILLTKIPILTRDYMKLKAYCSDQIAARIERKTDPDHPDIAHFLIEAISKVPEDQREQARKELDYDTKLLIIAGSDTTAATLSHLFFWLAKDQVLQNRLKDDLEEKIGDGEQITHLKVQESALLIGCINETLRLNPPVPSGLYRKAPKEGVIIGGTFIAGDTTVQIPNYVLGHDETNYVRPEDFISERWSTSPELIRNRDAFQPFSMGPYGCIGKSLALMEIQLVTARLLRDFDVKLADGESGEALFEKSRDHFTIALQPLKLVFLARTK